MSVFIQGRGGIGLGEDNNVPQPRSNKPISRSGWRRAVPLDGPGWAVWELPTEDGHLQKSLLL